MHPLVKLARETIERFVEQGLLPEPVTALPPDLPSRAGCFVSIHTHGALRGCIGTIEPTKASLMEEVMANAVSAATRDPRFPAITPGELQHLDIKVDVLGDPEPVTSLDQLDPRQYGVIVQSRQRPWKRGLLLPDLEGVDTVQEQIAIARRKAYLAPDEDAELYRFTVHRYG